MKLRKDRVAIMEWKAKWIKPQKDMGDVVPEFHRTFSCGKEVAKAVLKITALGVYEAAINGKRVGEFIMAPGWTTYEHRLQYQEYDVTKLLNMPGTGNCFTVLVGKGWYRGRLVGWQSSPAQQELQKNPAGLLVQLDIEYSDGTCTQVLSDSTWKVRESSIRFSEIYDGEICDAAAEQSAPEETEEFDGPFDHLIPQEGEEVREHERLVPKEIFRTPAGEVVVDFGQEITGYVEISVNAEKGGVVDLSFAEVMDKNGNFYTENYRSAKALYRYTCREGQQTYKPRLTFYGFRYIRVNAFPGGPEHVSPDAFTAIAVYSDIKRTGSLRSSDPLLNRLIENIFWSQKDNFLDVPTDCPQRDERLGWTGDAQAFAKTAAYNFDTEKFYTKWLGDLAADQGADGYVGFVIPDLLKADDPSTAWGDAAVIVPWEVYLAYGNKEILERQYSSMCGWVRYITEHTTTPGLWTGGTHFGDWLGLDAEEGSYMGASRDDFIASAFYTHAIMLVIKAGKVLGKDTRSYEELYHTCRDTFLRTFGECKTQTECVLALHFDLTEQREKVSAQLADMIQSCGCHLQTGFVGTPYLLHVLSENGYEELAYTLLLRQEYPSWLYPVTKGATTIWEHWDGIKENGDFWSSDMNSYNHYAYGSVADWMYGVMAGIKPVEEAPGYEKVRIAPVPDSRLEWFEASLDTRHGHIRSGWYQENGSFRYEIDVPIEAEIVIAGKTYDAAPGSYIFYSSAKKEEQC